MTTPQVIALLMPLFAVLFAYLMARILFRFYEPKTKLQQPNPKEQDLRLR